MTWAQRLAGILKISGPGRTTRLSAFRYFACIECSRGERREMIAIAMGQPGIATRNPWTWPAERFDYGSLWPGMRQRRGKSACGTGRTYRVREIIRKPRSSV